MTEGDEGMEIGPPERRLSGFDKAMRVSVVTAFLGIIGLICIYPPTAEIGPEDEPYHVIAPLPEIHNAPAAVSQATNGA